MTSPPRRSRWPVITAITVAVVAVVAAGGAAVVGASRDGSEAETPTAHEAAEATPAAGDCVEVAPDTDGALHATETACDADFGFIVADPSGEDCAKWGATFPEPFGDAYTATLCLVPNFTVGHCYRYGAPSGMYDETGCNTKSYAVFRIDAKDESTDESLCSEDTDSRAMTFESPPLTYCYSSMGSP